MRRVIAALIVVGLAIGVVLLWPDSTADTPPPTVAGPTTTASTPTTAADTSTTTAADNTSSTSEEDSHVVETVEEAEEILRRLWFGWFEGIYNQDEQRIREVVVLEETVATARQSFGVEFDRAPLPEDITFSDTEILRSDRHCLAVWAVMAISGFREGSTDGVYVLRNTDDGWLRLSTWIEREDLWEADCESTLPSS